MLRSLLSLICLTTENSLQKTTHFYFALYFCAIIYPLQFSYVKSALQFLLRPLIMLRQRLLKLWLFCLLAAVGFGSAVQHNGHQRPNDLYPFHQQHPLLSFGQNLHWGPNAGVLWFSSSVIYASPSKTTKLFSLFKYHRFFLGHMERVAKSK